jgi:soluble lytic murein transglycosylase-like protein
MTAFDLAIFEACVEVCQEIEDESRDPHAVSSKGAKGLMQVMDATGKEMWQEMGNDPATYDPFNPEQNIAVGTAYLRKMFTQMGDWRLMYAAYNTGPNRVSKLCHKYGDDYSFIRDHLSDETQNYVRKATVKLARRGVYI